MTESQCESLLAWFVIISIWISSDWDQGAGSLTSQASRSDFRQRSPLLPRMRMHCSDPQLYEPTNVRCRRFIRGWGSNPRLEVEKLSIPGVSLSLGRHGLHPLSAYQNQGLWLDFGDAVRARQSKSWNLYLVQGRKRSPDCFIGCRIKSECTSRLLLLIFLF
jgi:hypothetical protein